MRHLILSGLAAVFLATPVVADRPVCDPNPRRTVEDFETAKDALLRGEFDRFFDAVQPFDRAADPSRLRAVQRFENTFPNGFRECASVVFRSEAPGLFQEIVLYDTGAQPLALYLRGARFRDEIRVIDFVLSDSPTEVVNLLQ
ncbi:MAG: hypothetical protein AAGA71_15240 [Pseudomonadota bacterium]